MPGQTRSNYLFQCIINSITAVLLSVSFLRLDAGEPTTDGWISSVGRRSAWLAASSRAGLGHSNGFRICDSLISRSLWDIFRAAGMHNQAARHTPRKAHPCLCHAFCGNISPPCGSPSVSLFLISPWQQISKFPAKLRLSLHPRNRSGDFGSNLASVRADFRLVIIPLHDYLHSEHTRFKDFH